MKNKKDLLAIVGLLILATIFSFSYLNFNPKTALSQTNNKYTIFNTQNQGFKFMRSEITSYQYKFVEDPSKSQSYTTPWPFHQLPCDKKWTDNECGNFYSTTSPYTDAYYTVGNNIYYIAYDIDGGCSWLGLGPCWIAYKAYYFAQSPQPGYYRFPDLDFGVNYNSDSRYFWYPGKTGVKGELASCEWDWNSFACIDKTPDPNKDKSGYDVKIYSNGNKMTLEAKYLNITQVPITKTSLAPLFAATPDENSPGNQVVTKEYIEKYINPASGFSFGYKLTKYSQKDANLVCNPKDTQTFYVRNNQCYDGSSYVASGTVINAVVDPKTNGMSCFERYYGMERSENKEEAFTYFNNDLIKYEVTILQGARWPSYPGEIVWWQGYTDWCGVVDVSEPINKLCQNGCVISYTGYGDTRGAGVYSAVSYYSSIDDLKNSFTRCGGADCSFKDGAVWAWCVFKWKVGTNEFYIQDYSGRYQSPGFCGMIIRKL
jgi:hypothetical protein